MAEVGKLSVEKKDNKIILSRIFDAPKDLVYSMFSNPEHLAKWWGPETWPATIVAFDFKPGGVWHYYMQGPEGEKSWGKATFQEIDEPNHISFTDVFSNENGDADESAPQGKVTIDFEDVDGKTLITSVGEYESAEQVEELVKMGMIEGVTDTWNQLDKLLASQK